MIASTRPTAPQQRSPFWLLVISFYQREVRSRYKRSLLGWLWSLINPLSTVLIYTIVFGMFLVSKAPPTKNGRAEIFSVYLFVGLVSWNLFANIVNGAMDWLTGVMDLRKKVYFPTETTILGGAMATMVQTMFEVALLLLIMASLRQLSWTFILLFPILLAAASFALGLGFFVSILNARFRDVRYLVGIALSLQFFLVPIVYPESLIQSATIKTYGLPVKQIVLWNPVSQFVQASHDAVYFLQVPSLSRWLAMLAYAVISPALGLVYFRRRSMEISEEL